MLRNTKTIEDALMNLLSNLDRNSNQLEELMNNRVCENSTTVGELKTNIDNVNSLDVSFMDDMDLSKSHAFDLGKKQMLDLISKKIKTLLKAQTVKDAEKDLSPLFNAAA